jgi:hypothetical protein
LNARADVAANGTMTNMQVRIGDIFDVWMPVVREDLPPVGIIQRILICSGVDLPPSPFRLADDPIRMYDGEPKPLVPYRTSRRDWHGCAIAER